MPSPLHPSFGNNEVLIDVSQRKTALDPALQSWWHPVKPWLCNAGSSEAEIYADLAEDRYDAKHAECMVALATMRS